MHLKSAPPKYQCDPKYLMAAVQNGYSCKTLGNFVQGSIPTRILFSTACRQQRHFPISIPRFQWWFKWSKTSLWPPQKNKTANDELFRFMASDHNGFFAPETNPLLFDAIQLGCTSFLRLNSEECKDLVASKPFLLQACAMDGEVLQYAPSNLQKDPECLQIALNSTKPISVETLISTFQKKKIWKNCQ